MQRTTTALEDVNATKHPFLIHANSAKHRRAVSCRCTQLARWAQGSGSVQIRAQKKGHMQKYNATHGRAVSCRCIQLAGWAQGSGSVQTAHCRHTLTPLHYQDYVWSLSNTVAWL